MAGSIGASARSLFTGMVSVLALAAIDSRAVALVDVAGSAQPLPTTASSSSPVQQAEALLVEGRVIAARERLIDAVRGAGAASLSEADRDRASVLLTSVDKRIRTSDVAEISIQKAELALEQGDLRFAERHASAAKRQSRLTAAQTDRADTVLAALSTRRTELASTMPSLIRQAQSAFEAGQYAQAKDALTTIYRSGVELDTEQRRIVDGYQVKIVDLERQAGSPFTATPVNAAMMQPGTVRRVTPDQPAPAPSEPAPTQAEPAPTPVEPAMTTTIVQTPGVQDTPTSAPAGEPAPTPVEAASPTPVTTYEPATITPTAQPAADNMVQQALSADAQAKLAEADLAFSQQKFADALRLYEASLASGRSYLSADDVKRAEDRIVEARAKTGTQDVSGLAGQVLSNERIIRERAQAEFDNYTKQASDALKAGDTAKALENQVSAKATIDRAKTYFSQSENEVYATQLDALKKQIDAADEVRRTTEAQARETELKSKAEARQQDLRTEKEKRIVDAINRVRALQQEQKYEEALQVLDQVLFLDPGQPTALLLRDVISDVVIYRKYEDIQRRQRINLMFESVAVEDAKVPPRHLIEYPTNWPTKSADRAEGIGFAESPENARTLAALQSKRVPVQFRNNKLADAIAYLAQNTGSNVDVNWDSLQTIGIGRDTPVNLMLKDVPAKVALEHVLAKVSRDATARADYTVSDGIITIASAEDIKRQTVTALYSITDLLLEIPDYNKVPRLDLSEVLADVHSQQRQSPFTAKLAGQEGEGRSDRDQRVSKITQLITSTVDMDSWREHGGDIGSLQELNGSLVVTTTPRNHREIAGLLSKLRDIRSLQLNVETRFLLVNQDFFEQIGFDIDIVFNPNSNMVNAARAVDPSVLPSDFFDFTNAQPINRTITGSNSLTGVSPPSQTSTQTQQGVVTPNRLSPVGAGNNTLGLAQALAPASGFARDILSSAPGLGVAGRFLDDIQVDFLVKATQADRRTVTLTAPRLTLTNGQISNVYVATQRSFISDLTPVVGDSSVGFDPTTSTVTEGVTLLVEGVISSDRRYVTMNVDTGISQIGTIRQVEVSAVAGGQLVGSASANSFIELPEQTVTRVQTTVTVPDEGTILLGGQRLINELEVETGVPVLSKIPIINRFFTNRVYSKEESTLLILLKPTVLIQTEEEERNFPGLNDSIRNGTNR